MPYATQSDLEAVFGATNIRKWADLDNSGVDDDIEARIEVALAWAENEVNSRLRKFIYELPITDGNSGTPLEIVDVTSNLAGVWLYENRGVQDFSPETGQAVHRLQWNRRRAENTLREILAGVRTLDSPLRATSFVPSAVVDEDS